MSLRARRGESTSGMPPACLWGGLSPKQTVGLKSLTEALNTAVTINLCKFELRDSTVYVYKCMVSSKFSWFRSMLKP